MTMTLEALKEQARALSRQEQAALTADLMERLFQVPWDHDLAAECEAAIDAVDSGKMSTMNGREFFAQLREELTA